MLASLRPSGTVTFLFTDVEGSTRLWDAHPQAMQPALARHDAILRDSIAAAGGWTFKTIGDAFCAAFATAPEALMAAAEAQRRLSQEAWPEPVRIRVRMALHTGSVESRDDDYFGPPLNRVARLLAAGHGGQTLITEVVQELVRDALPTDVSLRPLGEHRLRDLVRPEQIYQVVRDGVFEEFPPLKTLDSPDLPNNLPLGTTSFVGRQKELADVIASIGSGRLTTLLGPGGCGKTRLALQAAADVLENFPDGVWFVDLAALSDPSLVPGAALAAIGIREQPGESPSTTLVETLKPRRLLLVLDNCEHLIEACARMVTELLRSCREVKVVATSREALGIAGERTVRVPSLSMPDPAHRATVESLGQYDAVRLFVERATQHQPSFAVTNENAPAIAHLCYRLDGIPLALELAAARVRSLPVEEVNRRLDNLFRLLTGGDRTALPRQQTLRAAIDWSFELLTPAERTLLLRLGAFAGGWTIEAAEAVAAGGEIEEWEVLDGLTSLVDKSLVVNEGSRYRMLETIRQYVRERTPLEEIEAISDRHRDYFLSVVGTAGIRQRMAKGAHDDIAREFPNVRLAIERMLADPRPEHIGHWLVLALYWMRRGGLGEAIPWIERLLTAARGWSPSFDLANLYIWLGAVFTRTSDGGRALALMEEGIEMGRRLGSDEVVAHGLYNLSDVCWRHGWSDRGIEAATEALSMGGVPLVTRLNLANNVAISGDLARARGLLYESLPLMESEGRVDGMSEANFFLGWVVLGEGDPETALEHFRTGIAQGLAAGDRGTTCYSVFGAARVQAALGRFEESAILLGLHDGVHRTDGTGMPPVFFEEHAELKRALVERLGPERFAECSARGEALRLEDAAGLL